MRIELRPSALYLLSGPPGCGKSTMLSRAVAAGALREEMIVSSDKIRLSLFGPVDRPVDGRILSVPRGVDDGAVFRIAREMVAARLKQGLLTIVDATSIDDRARREWVKLARELLVPAEILIFDAPEDRVASWNLARSASVPEDVQRRFLNRFQRDSRYPWRAVDPVKDEFRFDPWMLPHEKIDVVGDVHGLYRPMVELLSRMGYREDEGSGFVHLEDPERRILWLGDVIDRGPDNLKTLRAIRRAVQNGGHFMIQGNHERNMVRLLTEYLNNGSLPNDMPFSRAMTALEICCGSSVDEVRSLRDFMARLPLYYLYGTQDSGVAFVHADVSSFDPMSAPAGEVVHGMSGFKDPPADEAYDKLVGGERQAWEIVRGHIPDPGKPVHVLSLDEKQAFAGSMAGIAMEDLCHPVGSSRDRVTRVKVSYDFTKVEDARMALKKSLDRLVKRKLVIRRVGPDGLALYKYAKRVFWDNLWDEDPALMKARGLVLDQAGGIAQHPFDKVFNDGENGAGDDLSDDHPVRIVEKINGFLGCVTTNPLRSGELLETTTGSFESPYVEMFRKSLRSDPEFHGRLRFFLSREPLTLMFEIVHPDDPHIIPYDESWHGPWLIGARGKEQDAALLAEDDLDEIAERIGARRPAFRDTCALGVARRICAGSRVHGRPVEGFLVLDWKTGAPIMKMKTPWYLGRKFLARMGEGKVKTMFRNPEAMCREADEEIAPMIRAIVARVPENEFLDMGDQDRLSLLEEISSAGAFATTADGADPARLSP